MADRKIEDYTYAHDISNSAAKRRLRGKKKSSGVVENRGVPVPGTGKPKGASK